MKRNSIYKKALVLAAVLALALILLVGCGQTTSGDSNLNQFVKPDTGSQQQTGTVKTALSGDAARQLLLNSIIYAKTIEPNSRYITFSFTPYVYVEKEGKTDKYTVKVQGSIDTLGGRDDKQYPVNESVMTFEVLKESADLTTVVLGIYAKGGDMYIDFNDYATGKAVHRYYVSDSDIAYVVGLLKDILNQLKIEEVLTDYDLGSLINDASIKKLISDILHTDSDDKLTLFNIMLSLISESGSYSVTNPDGSVDLVMPTKLNAIFAPPQGTPALLLKQVGKVVNNLLSKQSDIIKGVVNFLVGDILSGKKTLNTAFVANISNNRFQKLALNVVSTKGGVDKTMELGVGGLSKSADFANQVKNSMPELVKADRKNYSFTTLSADLDINLDIAKQEYSIENIDGAVGGAIAKALEGITGTEIYKKSDAIQILEPLQISLHLKLRAEINLKDNKKTRAVIELNGKDKKGNDRTYLGLYYIGADNALYADMSGLGGGKAMIPDVNLNQILKDLIAAKIPEIPSIMEIIGGKGSGAASGDVINAGLIEAVQSKMDNGELVVTHYGLAAGDDDSAAVEETASLDIMALIGSLNIVKGDSTPLTVESISASLTKDVIAGLMGKLGMKLPIDKLDLKICQTREDYEAGEEGWEIDVAVNMATEERGQILGGQVGLFLNYGNPDPSLDGYLKGKEFKSVEKGGEYINAGKLSYKDGEFDFDLWVSVGLELELEFNIRENSVIDLSALGKLLYNLALKVQSPDGVNAKFNLKINANANVMALVNAIKNGADVAKILGAIDARIDITTGEEQNAKTAVLLLEDGMLYLNSSDGEFRNYKINILEALGGNFKLFGKDVSGTGSALASGEGDTTEGEGGDAPATEEKAKFDIVGLLLANINCISINRDRLEVAIADTLITALLNGLGVDTEIVKGLNFSSKDTAISLEYDGLNLSKLWLKANVGIQQGDNAALGLGLGLGHIVLTVGKRNLAALGERNILEDEYQDLLNGGNVYLGLGAEIDVALDDETYVLEDLLGALVANFALGTTIDIKDEIKGGLTFNIVADIDISSKPDQNDSRILIEIRKKSNGKVFLGLYYDQKTTTLYLKTDDGTIIQPVALKFDLIGLLEGLINKGDGTASADIDLSELNPVILLSNKGLQIQVMTGITKLLVGVLVGDMNDYIEYNAGATSYKYYAYDANTDYTILQNAYPLANPVGQKDLYQRNVDKYEYVDGAFVQTNGYVGNDFFVKAKEGSFFYVLKDNATGIDEKYFEKNADGTLKEFANSGRKFTLIDASNKDIYASAPKYYQSEFKRADTLMFDMDKDVMEFTKGFIPAYNKTSGLTTYVKVDASKQEVALYEVFTQGYTMKDVFDENGKPTDETKRMELKLPELGASIVIGKIEDGDVSVVEGGTKFSGIGIGIFIMRNGATEPVSYVEIAEGEEYTGKRYDLVNGKYKEAADGKYKQVSNTAANVAIKLGNIQLSEKTFKENYGVTLEQFIDGLQNENLPQADATNIADLTVYVNVEAGIEIGAIKTAAGGDTWAIGGLLSGIVKGNEKVPSALADFLKSLLIKFNVQDKFKDVIGLRIAGNVNIGALLSGDTKDTMQIVKALLMNSDLAVELTDDYPWAATKNTVVGIYVTEGTIYINIDGEKTIKDTKLKIGVDKVLGMVGSASTGALASADLGVEGILSIINNIVKEISIYRNDEASGMTISLSKNMLGAILKLVADIDGVDLKLNETNSFIELNTKVTDKKPYLLKLSVGIDPLVLGIALGGLKIGLAANNDVLKNLNKAEYKGLSEIETMALDVEIGVDLGLKQGEFPIGKLVSGILQATGTDLEFPLNLDIQNELDLDLRVRLAGNLNLKEFGKSDLMLQVRNAAPGKAKTILGLYFTTEKDATGKDIPCLYVETQFFSQSAPVRSKVENFDLLGSLLGKTVSGVVEYLGGKVEGTGAALASDDGATTNEAEIILELASKSIQVKIAEETVKGLLEALVGDKVGDDIIEIINGLGLSAEVAVNLKDENKPLLSVVATCSYLDLGILVNKVNLSTEKQDIFGTTLSGNTWTKAEDAKKSALGVQFGVELNYDISDGKHSLDAILSNVASAAAFEKDATMATVGSILKAVSLDAIIKNTHGSIGIDVVLNVKSEKMTEYLLPAGQALYELVMGKLGAEYTAGNEKYDPLQLLNMVEALIKINLNGNPVFVSLKDGYVYVSLSAVGGDNFKASLKNIIDQIKKTTGSGSSALATGEGDGEDKKDDKKTDFVLVNKILQNLLASASISDTGLDLALAPDLMNVLLENVVAKLLGDTFGFNDDVKAMFTLSSPYAKLSDGKTSVDDVLYTEKVEERYVRYNAAFESQQGSEQYFFDAEANVYRTLYKQSPDGTNVFVLYTGGEVEKLYYKSGDEYVGITTAPAELKKFVKYEHKSYLAVYNSADKEARSLVSAKDYDGTATVYDANGNPVAEDNLFVKVKHSGIGWTKDNGISIDLVFDNPNTTKTPDFSIGLGLDATLVLQGEAIEVIPYFVKKAGAKLLDNQEVKGYFKEGTALVEIPASEVYTGTRYDKDGNVDENGKFRKELVEGTEADHDLVLIGNIFPEVSETVGDEKIYLSMELGLTLSGTKDKNDRILDFVADIIDVSNRTSTTMKYVEFAENEDKAGYTAQRYSKTGAMAYAQDVNGTFKRGAYYLAEEGYVGTKFVKNTDGTFTIDNANGTYKFVADDSAKTYFPILPEEAETYPADKKYREDGKGFVTDANGDFKAGEYSVTDRTKGGVKFRLNAKTGKYFVYEATGITLYKQGNYYEIDKDELATFKGVRFDYDSVKKVATVNPSGKYQFVAEEGAYYPVLENDGYTGKLYRVSEASTPDNTIYIEDVIYKFTPAFTGKDLKDLNALAKLLVSIGEFEAEARVKVTVGANVAELVKALSNTANIDIAELLKHVELAIESLDSKGTVKGGIYLYNSTLYIKYINTSRGIFSMPVSELFGALASASADERMPYDAAMLQLWVGEFIKLNGVYTTGIAVQATTSLVETLLETLLGFEKGTISLAAFGAVGVEVTIVTASPVFPENADGEVYVKKAYEFVEITDATNYKGEKFIKLDDTYVEAKDGKYKAVYVTEYEKLKDGEVYEGVTYNLVDGAYVPAAEGTVGEYKAVEKIKYVLIADDEVYEGIKFNRVYGEYVFVEKAPDGAKLYQRVKLEDAAVEYKNINALPEGWLLSECEGYDSAYAEALTTRYTKVTKTDGTEIFEELKFGFDFNSFGIGIGLKIGHVGFNLNIGKIDLGLIDGTQSIVPDEVKNAPIAQETVIDLSLEVNLGLEFMDKNTNATTGFDIGKFVDGLGVLTGVTLGEDWLKLTVPEGGAEVRLSLRVALALNLTNVDHSVAAIEIVGQIFEGNKKIGEKTLIGVYYKDGNVLLNLAGLGFDNIRISGLRLSDLLGGSSGVEILKKLLGGSGSSSALASEVNFTVVEDKNELKAAALVFDQNRIAVEVGTLFIEKLLGIAALGLDENTQKLLGGLDLKALVEVNFGEKFVEIPSGETFSGTKYAYDNETKKYYIDNDNGTFKRESNISLKLNAEAAELLGINVAVENIKIGNTGVEEKVKAIDINDYAEFIEILFGTEKDENGNEIVDANGKPKKKIVGFEPKLEALTLSLDIDLGAMFTNGMAMGRSILDSEGKTVLTNVSSVGAIGNGNMGIRASVKLEIAFAALLNKLQQGFDSSDIFAAIEQALPLVKAQISIYAQSDGDELIGIYVADGNVYLMLDGLGMPNIKVTGEFLMDIIRAATGSGTALSSDEATASVETSQIIGIVKQIVQGISVGGKALKVAFQNDYFAKLIDAVLSIVLNKGGFKYYQDVLPEVPTDVAFSGLTINLAGIENTYEPIYRKDGKYYTDAGCTSQYYGMVFFKNTVTNHIELFSEKEYVKQFGEVDETTMFYRSTRNGLVELDLVAYSTHLKLAVNMPKLGAQKNIISSPEVAGVAFTEADEVTGVALGLKGQVKIDKQPGIALANILSGVVGDLETKLVIEEDIDIRFAIEAAVGIKYSLKDKSFALSAVDLRISLARYYATDNKTVPLAVLTYISSEGTLYVDVSHFFQKQNEGNNKNLGMLKITGVNVLDLINGLITGEGSATSVALGSSDAWVEDEQQPYTYVYYEANAINSAAPAKFVHVAQLNDKDEPRMVYRNYTGTITAEFKTEDGKDLYVRDRSNKVTGYTLLSAENAEKFSHKAKYTYEQAMTYTKLTDLYVKVGEDYVLAAGDADVTGTALYKRVVGNYVKIADGETVNAEDRYEQNADGTYTQNANGTFKAVYKFVKVSDGSAWYIEEYNSETCKYVYNVYDGDNPNHKAPTLYHYDETEKKYVESAGVGGAKSYVKVPVYSISAVWADLRNYGIADNVAGYDVKSNAKVNITGKAMLGLIGGLMDKAGLEDILDALLVSVHATKDPFIFGADISILDVYNDHKLALNVGLNIFGFDFEKREGAGNTDGSYLEFLDAENTISFKPENANSYRQFADIDLNRILSASEIMDVLVDSLDFGKSGKIYLNLSLDADSFAKDTGDNFVPWEKYFAALLGLNENSARVLYQVLFPEDELDGKGNFSIDIAAAIDVKKLFGGLIAGTGLNLEGTEIRITINSDTMLFSEDLRKDGSKIVITAIGEADGILSVFIDNSGYRGKGKHVARLDLNAILGTATSSAAYASANENTGLIPENIFGVLNALLGEVRLGGGKISVVLRENFIGALLNTLVGTDITEQQSLVKGEIYIDLRNLEVGIEMILGDDNYVSEGERDFYIGLRIGGINMTAPDGFDMTEYTFIKKADRANFKNIKQLKLDINFESEWYYDATNKTEGFDISPVVDILETILKKELFPDRLLQVLVKDDKIDAVYATAISAHIDLADFNNMKLSVEIFKSTSEEPVRELKLGVYLDGQSLYVDLSGWGLPKIKLGGLNLGNTINDALLPLLDQYLVGDDNKRGGETAALASSYVGDYDKNHIEYSDFVEAADGKYVLVYTESNSGGYVLVDGKYVKYNAKEHAGATRYARKVEEYDMANTAHQNVTRYNVNKGAFRSSWGKVLFPVAYEEDANGAYVLIDGKYVPFNAEEHAGQKRYKEVSGNKPYISLLLANNRFGFGINADLINSLLETILGALNLDIQLPDFGDAVLLFDSRKDLNGDGYADTQLDLAVQVNDNLYFGFRTTNLEITGNSTKVSHAETRYAEVVGDGKEFVTVYDIEKGEIGLETVALGFNVQIRQNCVDNGQSDFEKYLGVLLKSLLGINNFTLNLPSSGEIGCDIDLRVSLNLANLVKALQGGNVDWWSDIELYLDLKPLGYGSLLTMYKQKGDADVYADLSGLSLFKVKIIGLQSLIGGLVSASATALASGDDTATKVPAPVGEKAILTVIPGKTGFKIEIGWGFIEGLLTSLLGDKLHFGEGGQCSDLYVRTIAGYNDTEVNITYDECNPFGMILGDFGDKDKLTENIPNAVSNSTISAFNELSKLFANSLAKFGIPADGNVYNRVVAETDKEAWEQYTAFYNKAMGIYDSAFAKIARNLNKSAIVGIKDIIEEDGTLIRTPYTIGFGENIEGVDYQEVIARLFGFKSAVAFKNAIINLKSLYEDYMKNPVNKALENGCVNTAYQIEVFSGKSFVFPIVVKNEITTPILTYVIIDNNGSASVWVSDIGEAMKATNFNAEHTTGSTVNNRLFGKYALFVTGMNLVGYKTITIGEGATATVIPLPKMNNDRALSLSINHASAMYNRSLEIDLKLGFNTNDESAVNLKIHNFVLTSGANNAKNYIRFGASNGTVNTSGTNVMNDITGDNEKSFSGLVLSDAKGISLVNILTSVIKGIDPDITISWKKNTNHYYTNSKRESYNSNQYATIELSRTDKKSEHMSGTNVRTYAGKFQAKINNDKDRLIGAWLFNNQLYIDITKTLDFTLGIGALRKMKVADLDILGLLGGLGSASATNAMASDDATTEKSLKDTVSGFVKGIQVNWWNNQSVVGSDVGDKAITTIRVDLNGKGLNNILAKLYYMLYGMYNTNAPAAELFSDEALYQMVYTEGQDVTLKDGTVVKSVNAHGKCVFYLQTFAANMIGSSVNGTIGGWLKPGTLGTGDILREILGRLLPLPKLDEAENGRPSYVEIVIDKSRLASKKGVLKQIALVINKERTKNEAGTITEVGNKDDTAEIVINLDNNVTLRSVSAVRDYNTNSTRPNEDSGKTINVANPFDPVELTSAALNSAGLLDRVAADFYGISEYDSKSQKGVNDSYAELGGTPIVWDTSTAILEPGKESEIWGYALNYKVQKVKVKVSNSTGFLRLFGYFKADGTTFVETNKITVDPTKDPTGTDNISAGLPRIIVIMRRDGELQVLSRDYDKDKPGTVNINGTDYTVDGKFNWIDEDTVEEGATVEKLFWYQVGYSSRIQKSIKVKYNNVDIVSGSLPNDDKFGILNGGTAFDFTPENFDIVGNLGLPSIKASETFTKVGDKFSYVGFDGSTYEFIPGTAPTDETELAEWNKHALGGNGTFTRSFNGKVLQSGTYVYVAAESTAAGILDSLGGLFGGSGANADSGKYALTVTDTGYTGLKEITIKLGTGKTTTVDVIEWNYDDFKYDMRKPQNGASGRIVAVINKYEIKRTTGLVEKTEVVNSKQKIRLDVGITQESLSALADGDLKFNQYEDAFVLSATGDYVLETRDAFIPYDETLHKDKKQYALVNGKYVDASKATADNTARYVEGKVTGYVYDKYADGKPADNRYAINIFDAEELYVKVKHSRITSETQQFHVGDFKFYTDTFAATDTQTPFTMFVVPELGVKTERNITVKALYDVNGAYEQIFDIKVVVTPKVATKVVLLIDNDRLIDRTYLESTAEVTVYYKDGTEKQGLAKDLIRLTDKEIEKIANAKDHLGITYGTASVFKKGRYELIAAGETYDGQRFNLVDGNFVKATDGAYKFFEDETFVQNGVTFEIRVFSKN
ncbi:MAG: hypothetical protein MR741_03160 [Clostridiales bacterium]|nr:hypothetical protein [Clostridiales bacterium]